MCWVVVKVDSELAQFNSFHRKAGPVQKFFEAFGYYLAVGAAAVVVEEEDGGICDALVGGGDPVPGAATSGGEAKARA